MRTLALGRGAPAVFPHAGLDSLATLRPLLSRSVPNGGDWSTVNVGPVDVDRPSSSIPVPGYREIIDLSPANDSRFLTDVGQSGPSAVQTLRRFPAGLAGREAHERCGWNDADIERGARSERSDSRRGTDEVSSLKALRSA